MLEESDTSDTLKVNQAMEKLRYSSIPDHTDSTPTPRMRHDIPGKMLLTQSSLSHTQYMAFNYVMKYKESKKKYLFFTDKASDITKLGKVESNGKLKK
jgi:hypothetical protein